MKKIGILQLSDLHIAASTDWELMKIGYKKIINNNQIDMVLVTGDLHNFGTDYTLAEMFLENLLKELNLTKNNIFFIPGNHDSGDFEHKNVFIKDIRENIEEDQDYYLKYFTKECLKKSFVNYNNFIKKFLEGFVEYTDKEPSDISISKWNDALNIIQLNTAILCDGDNTKKQIVDIQSLTKELVKLDRSIPSIVIAHHDYQCLYENHKNTLRRLFDEYNISAYLCGDLHYIKREHIEKYHISDNVPCIVCGKSAIETKDNYSIFSCINYVIEDNKVTVLPQKWNNKNKHFKYDNILELDDDGPYSFYLAKNHEVESPMNDNFKQSKSPNTTKPISIWLPDAEKGEGSQTRFNTYTNVGKIREFVESDNKFGVAAVKGAGKTFALQIKRIKQSKAKLCLPITKEKPSSKNQWGTECIILDNTEFLSPLKNFNNIVLLWKYSIISYVINQLVVHSSEKYNISNIDDISKKTNELLENDEIDKLTHILCSSKDFSSLNLIINKVLRNDNWTSIVANDYYEMIRQKANIRNSLRLLKKKSVAIFIDKTDQSIKQANAEPPVDCRFCGKADKINKCNNSFKNTEFCIGRDNNCNETCCYGCEYFSSKYSNINLRIYDQNGKQKYQHINMWQHIQLGLVGAVAQLQEEWQGVIEIFYTIRQEAYASEVSIIGGEHDAKIQNFTQELWYKKHEQKEIFYECIKNQNNYYLFEPNLKSIPGKEEYAFVGTSSLCHPYVSDGTESIFDSIYRHSFDRARDLQYYGMAITEHIDEIRNCNLPEERANIVKRVIEKTAGELAFTNTNSKQSNNTSYYFEKMKFLPSYWTDPDNFENVISKIDRNLLFQDDICHICKQINNVVVCNGQCQKMNCKRHPFSIMYKLGLLGRLNLRSSDNYAVQTFLDAKDITYVEEKDALYLENESNAMFIIHPALTKSIEQIIGRPIKHFNGFILGKEINVSKNEINKIFNDYRNMKKVDFTNKYYYFN